MLELLRNRGLADLIYHSLGLLIRTESPVWLAAAIHKLGVSIVMISNWWIEVRPSRR